MHKATASRALNPATVHRVHAETAKRVQAVAEELDYRPNMNARHLRAGSSETVGVIVPDLLSELYPPLIRGIELVLRATDHFLLVADTMRDTDQEDRALDSLVSRQVDGLIAASSYTSHPRLQRIANGGTPVVLLDVTVDPDGLSTVGPDFAGGVEELTRLLVEDGHRHIALVAGPEAVDNPPLRADLHAAALTRLGLDPAEALRTVRVDAYSAAEGHAAAMTVFERWPEVTAVVGHNDAIAVGIVHAAHEAGLDVPGDITVAGFNDIPFARYTTPPLTTVRYDSTRLGREAAEVLMAQINGTGQRERRAVPVTLVERGSHGPAKPRR